MDIIDDRLAFATERADELCEEVAEYRAMRTRLRIVLWVAGGAPTDVWRAPLTAGVATVRGGFLRIDGGPKEFVEWIKKHEKQGCIVEGSRCRVPMARVERLSIVAVAEADGRGYRLMPAFQPMRLY